MALVFLFALASVGLILVTMTHGTLTLGGALALACFVLLASGVFVALMKMARRWEAGDEPHE